MSWVRFSRFGLVVLAGSRASDQEEEAGVRQCPWVVGCNTCTAPALSLVFRLLPTSGQCPPFCYRHRWVGAAPCYRHRWVGAPRFSRATAISGRCRFFSPCFLRVTHSRPFSKFCFVLCLFVPFTHPRISHHDTSSTQQLLCSHPLVRVSVSIALLSHHTPEPGSSCVVRSQPCFGPLPFFSFSSSG